MIQYYNIRRVFFCDERMDYQMYFVDREKVEEILVFLEKQLALIEKTPAWETDIEKAALERLCHMTLEAILDVGNDMIDGFIMRDPGSYFDIIDILEDEKVITNEMAQGFKEVVQYRKEIVVEYTNINHEEMLAVYLKQLHLLKEFAPRVRRYIETELGPVSAFRN